jgi:hypothetical protein
LHPLVKAIAALGVIAASFFVTLWVMDYLGPSCPQGKATALARPFNKISGFSYVTELSQLESVADLSETPRRSNLLVCENNNLLGPMHTGHAEIAKDGHGRYSHWSKNLIFSASDNTDPNTNGRTYSVVQPQ